MKKPVLMLCAAALAFTAVPTLAQGGPPRGEKFFEEIDANKDGFISKEEMQAHQQKRLDEMFAATDTDKDGKLSRDEMKAFHEKMKAKRAEWRAKGGKGGPDGAPPPPPAE